MIILCEGGKGGGGGGGGYGSRFTTKKKPFHDSRVLKNQFHGKVDSNTII
jgi:hypothetical protein